MTISQNEHFNNSIVQQNGKMHLNVY